MPCSPRNAKRQGELAELVFLHRTTALGFTVSKPYGETAAYDFIVDADGTINRVQVRSVAVESRGLYRVSASYGTGSKHVLTAGHIDVLAAYVVPHKAWYLIPVHAFAPAKNIDLCPHRPSKRKYERFRETWDVLAVPRRHSQCAKLVRKSKSARRQRAGRSPARDAAMVAQDFSPGNTRPPCC